MRRLTCTSLLLSTGLLIALACGGCDDNDVCSPQVPAGRIQGYVRVGGLPVDAIINAIPIVDGEQLEARLEAEPDETGAYTLDLPAGHYLLELRIGGYWFRYKYAAPVLSYGQVPPDTVTIVQRHEPIEIDFDLGGVTVEVDLSDRLNDEYGTVYLHRQDEPAPSSHPYVNYGSEKIEDGRFTVQIPGVLPGNYQVEIILGRREYMCYCPYDGEHVWMPGTRDPEASPWYAVEVDSALDLSCSLTEPPSRLEGRVTDLALDVPSSRYPEVSIVTADSLLVMGRRRVDEDGSFGVDLHLPGPFKLRITQSELEQWVGGDSFAEATVYDPAPGETISDITHAPSCLSLNLTVPGNLLGETAFSFYDPTGTTLISQVIYNPYMMKSIFNIPNLRPGDYLLHVDHIDFQFPDVLWRPQWYDRSVTSAGAQVISIGVEEVVPIDLVLELGGQIRGTFDSGAEPMIDYYVFITSESSPEIFEYDYAWLGDPTFFLAGLADGGYKIGAYPVWLDWSPRDPITVELLWYPGTSDWAAAGVIEILDAAVVEGVDFGVD
jgi:hypothetical protein